MGQNSTPQHLQAVRLQNIIAVQEYDVIASCQTDSLLTGKELAAIFLVEHLDSCIFQRIIVQFFPALIRRTIINQDQFPIRKALSLDRSNARIQKGLGIIDRNNNAEFHKHTSF